MNVFVLTGAGISAESGLPTYRDKDGLWTHIDPVTVATPEAFGRDPKIVHAFYNERRRALLDAAPNPAHLALARLEAKLGGMGGSLFLCTQNIDDLHERAGSQQVVHIHGELLKTRCCACEAVMTWRGDLGADETCPNCKTTGRLRPHVVWFGEKQFAVDRAFDSLQRADLFVAIGSSGTAHPANSFITEARGLGIRTCEINLKPSDRTAQFDEGDYGLASDAVPRWAETFLATGEPFQPMPKAAFVSAKR